MTGTYLKEYFLASFFKYQRIELRDLSIGEDPFLYTTGNRGPGYVDVKGGVGIDDFMVTGARLLCNTLVEKGIPVDVVVGMMTGGAIPGYILKQMLQEDLQRPIIYIYQRSERKKVGHGDLDTGVRNNPYIKPDSNFLVIEELVNFASTTVTGVTNERNEGRHCDNAACLLFYDNPAAKKRLDDAGINMTYAVTLPEVLHFGFKNGFVKEGLYKDYLTLLEDPKLWHEKYGFPYYS